MNDSQASIAVIAGTLLFGLILTLMPLPSWVAVARPAFYPATILFWALIQPRQFGVIAAWCCGLLLDVAYGTPLGQHALAVGLAAFLVFKLKELLHTFPAWQQALTLLPIFLIYEFTLFWIDGVSGRQADALWRWLPAFSTALIWPLWGALLERIASVAVKT